MFLKQERKEGIALPAERQEISAPQPVSAAIPGQAEERQNILQPRMQSAQRSPPLFIKLDRYSEVVRNVQELQAYAMEVRRTVDMLAETEQRLNKVIGGAYKAMEGLDERLSLLTKRLAGEQQDMQNMPRAQKESEVTVYIKDVHGELDKIMDDLQKIR
ncbi:MAG: hypothetical protein HYX24_06080 [Candidatus Aenigmarchaeota archaeon]|nr:hypothetical protein [Candidatus Aenigmarchaeota archaeon]